MLELRATPCGQRYDWSTEASERTPAWCPVCQRFYGHSESSRRCPRCDELRCEDCELARRLHVERALVHGSYTVRRAGWEPGPWDREPDEFRWRYRELHCLALRNAHWGSWDGYCSPPRDKITEDEWQVVARAAGLSPGITYLAPAEWPVCAVHDDEGLWWVGFSHTYVEDEGPGRRAASGTSDLCLWEWTDPTADPYDPYTSLRTVVQEVERLVDAMFARLRARQPLAAVQPEHVPPA